MVTYFIADLHLTENRPDITALFLRFIANEAREADALYILGDLFEIWLGDDIQSPLTQSVAKGLSDLVDSGVPCFYIHGNRDFMLGERYARQCKMQILPEYSVIQLYDEPALILHGDTLCTQDEAYQNYRKWVYKPWLRWLFLALPKFVRARIGEKIRANSKAQSKLKQQHRKEIMDVCPEQVIADCQEHNVALMIHGHTHRPAIHHFNIQQQSATRIVLGDWYEQGSMLVVNPAGKQLITQDF
ncbi:UDP-2,3-diacylglucosamine diphosphatase [Motilimonas eburnea]|uniref:UDP-2,3-diacylglucosamine diphosphatase n=1 Tax=Motilimonas eburnea TaxID=1737488 RepID=UPI001E5AD115|nr:UDP-2,3-diacylglucosamine diphosphatase [Motilimonas eburnea]MCE2571621.1 UDP-2,3-diacylglucosamine diphosphatase [Motilimonas eburnea]